MNMSKINEYAKDYKPMAKTKNIADLSEVSTDLELEDDEYEFTDKVTKQKSDIKQKVVVVNGENYRVPLSVIQQLKIILEDNPNLKKFKVKRSGTKDWIALIILIIQIIIGIVLIIYGMYQIKCDNYLSATIIALGVFLLIGAGRKS